MSNNENFSHDVWETNKKIMLYFLHLLFFIEPFWSWVLGTWHRNCHFAVKSVVYEWNKQYVKKEHSLIRNSININDISARVCLLWRLKKFSIDLTKYSQRECYMLRCPSRHETTKLFKTFKIKLSSSRRWRMDIFNLVR